MPADKFKKLFEKKYLGKLHNSTLKELPVISTGRMTGQMTLNRKALEVLEVKPGDYVYIFDMGQFDSTVNERFFITKGFFFENEWQGVKIHELGRFNHSLIYNSILSKGAITCLDNLLMVRKGYFVRHGKEKFIAKSKVRMVLKPYFEVVNNARIDVFVPAPGISQQPFFQLTEWQVSD